MKTEIFIRYLFRSVVVLSLLLNSFIEISAQSADEYYSFAEELRESGDFEQAIMFYLKAAEIYEDEESGDEDLFYAAWCYFEVGDIYLEEFNDYDVAYSYLDHARELWAEEEESTNASLAGFVAGYAKYKLKQYTQATTDFLLAAENGLESEAYGNAGYAYDGAGHSIKYTDWNSAQTYWNKAKECFNKQGMSYIIPSELEIEISKPSSSPVLIGKLYTEIDELKQGEAVEISGRILFKGKPVTPNKKNMGIELTINGDEGKKGQCFAKTDDKGNFSILPFAGYDVGLYCISLTINYTLDNNVFTTSDTAYVSIKEYEQSIDDELKIEEILALYHAKIPAGPIRTNEDARDYLKWRPFVNLKEERNYGVYHNFFLVNERFDKGHNFTCAGYQNKVLNFLDSIRFNKDPSIRQLLDGLDFGPLARGPKAEAGKNESYFSHVAVVLFPLGTDWKENSKTVVLDPWFLQKPHAYNLSHWIRFGAFYGTYIPRIDEMFVSQDNPNDIFSGFPTTGNEIFVNSNAFVSSYKKPKNICNYKGIVKCPVTLLITDIDGKMAGITDEGETIQEFPSYIQCIGEDADSLLWYFELPDGHYTVNITGMDNGEFELALINDTLQSEPFVYEKQPINKDETATITLGPDIDMPVLILPDETEVEPVSGPVGIHEAQTNVNHNIIAQNQPNPFSEITMISFHLPRNTHVKLEVFDMSGKCINTLLNDFKNEGKHIVSWNGTNETGTRIQNGMYFYKITTDNYIVTNKILINR